MIYIPWVSAVQRAAGLANMQLSAMLGDEDANVQGALHPVGVHLSQAPAHDVASAVGELSNILHVGNGELQGFSAFHGRTFSFQSAKLPFFNLSTEATGDSGVLSLGGGIRTMHLLIRCPIPSAPSAQKKQRASQQAEDSDHRHSEEIRFLCNKSTNAQSKTFLRRHLMTYGMRSSTWLEAAEVSFTRASCSSGRMLYS